MNKRTFSIGEIAKILNIPSSTLRFWEEQGLFRVSKCANNYRSYTTTDLIRIADIVFYRNLGIPIRDVNGFITVPLDQYGDSLEEVQRQLEERIRKYEKMQQKVNLQRERYIELQKLLTRPFAVEELPFSYVISWDFWEKENLMYYMEDPARYVWYKDTSGNAPGQKGLIQFDMPKEAKSSVLFRKKEGTRFVTFPIRASVDDDYEGLEAEETVEKIQKEYHTGIFLAQHLLTCAEEGCLVEYLKGYLELIEPAEKPAPVLKSL